MHSILNDFGLRDFSFIIVSEPHCFREKEGNVVMTSPARHPNWTAIILNRHSDSRWLVRSMIWARTGVRVSQVASPPSDITAASVHIGERVLLVVSAYVPHNNNSQTATTDNSVQHVQIIEGVICETGARYRQEPEVILAGYFDRHDLSWGGDEVAFHNVEGKLSRSSNLPTISAPRTSLGTPHAMGQGPGIPTLS